MASLKKYNFKDDHGHPLENCQDYIDLIHRASSAESSLAAMRQRAEEAEASLLLHAKADGRGILRWQKATGQELVWPDQGNLVEWALAERDAAIARAERAEGTLRDAVSKLNQVKEYLEDYFEGTRDHRYIGIQCIIEIGVKRITNTLADAILPSPPADASTMGGDHIGGVTDMVGERERRLADSLYEIINYSGGADNALEDEYVMDRARAVLAEMEQKS